MCLICWSCLPFELLGASDPSSWSLYCQQSNPHNLQLPQIKSLTLFPSAFIWRLDSPGSNSMFCLLSLYLLLDTFGHQHIFLVGSGAPTGPLCPSLLPFSLSDSPRLSRKCSSVHSLTHQLACPSLEHFNSLLLPFHLNSESRGLPGSHSTPGSDPWEGVWR